MIENLFITFDRSNKNSALKEVVFIKKNEQVWNAFQAHMKGEKLLSPDDLADYYIQITDDLSYARTFYPESQKLIQHLNDLALHSHQQIFKNKKEESSRILDFWKYEVPIAIYKSHKEILYSLMIFLISISIGVVSTMIYEDFPRDILGDGYINMTLENIESGDPMGVYGSSDQGSMFFAIGSNNLRVSLLAYAVGILGSIFTGFILFTNGVMVGAFLWFFVQKGIGWLAISTIFIHGSLELSEIVIVGGAGLVLGNSYLFPGTYTRKDSLIEGAKRSLKIVIGSAPIVIVAALIESVLTREYMALGSIGRLIIITASFAYIYWYYYHLPREVAYNMGHE